MASGKDVFAREILEYLVQHQDAKDTLDGILHYWVRPICPDALDEQEVEQAVNGLVLRGWVMRREATTKTVYCLNHAHLKAIRAFLAKHGSMS